MVVQARVTSGEPARRAVGCKGGVMGWTYFKSLQGDALINWDGVYQLVRSYLHAQEMWNNSSVKTESKWIGPNVVSVEVDWDKVRAAKEQGVEPTVLGLFTIAQGSIQDFVSSLLRMMDEKRAYEQQYQSRVRTAQKQTMGNIEASVNRGEIALEGAKLVRDLSAGTLVVGATFLSGGTALGVLGAGSMLKGTAKYQDTGNLGSAAFEASVNMAFGLIGVKISAANMSTAETLMLNIVLGKAQSTLDPLQGWIEGKTVQEGVVSGVVKMGAAPWAELAKDGATEAIKDYMKSDPRFKLFAVPAQAVINLVVDRAAGALSERAAPQPKEAPGPPPRQEGQDLLDAVGKDLAFLNQFVVMQGAFCGL
jgi:hypothetical protein